MSKSFRCAPAVRSNVALVSVRAYLLMARARGVDERTLFEAADMQLQNNLCPGTAAEGPVPERTVAGSGGTAARQAARSGLFLPQACAAINVLPPSEVTVSQLITCARVRRCQRGLLPDDVVANSSGIHQSKSARQYAPGASA